MRHQQRDLIGSSSLDQFAAEVFRLLRVRLPRGTRFGWLAAGRRRRKAMSGRSRMPSTTRFSKRLLFSGINRRAEKCPGEFWRLGGVGSPRAPWPRRRGGRRTSRCRARCRRLITVERKGSDVSAGRRVGFDRHGRVAVARGGADGGSCDHGHGRATLLRSTAPPCGLMALSI